eukprot:3512839-Pyramimonas_sp.AAC.3
MEQLRNHVLELEAKLSEEERQRALATSAASEVDQLRQQVSELQDELSQAVRDRQSAVSVS